MKNLEAALEKQLTLLNEFHGLLKRETTELADVHLDAMAKINVQKDELSLRIHASTSELRTVIQEVAAREGLSLQTELGVLSIRLTQKGNREIALLHTALNETANQIKALLTLNCEIAERFASSIGTALDFIARIVNQTSTYGSSGSYQQRPAGAVMINREA